MKNCNKCGAQVTDDAKFCSNCGSTEFTQESAEAQTAPVQAEVLDGDADVNANKGIAWLAYLGLLLLVPLFARKASSYCKFHVMQGAKLLAVSIVYTTITEITKAIIRGIFPAHVRIGLLTYYYEPSAPTVIFTLLFAVGSIFIGVLSIMGIVNAATGKRKELLLMDKVPFVDNLMEKIYASLNK